MRWPAIRDLAALLRSANKHFDGPGEVRLQVYPGGAWYLREGDPAYDRDHHGYWGARELPGDGKRINTYKIAAALIDEAREQHAQEPKEDEVAS